MFSGKCSLWYSPFIMRHFLILTVLFCTCVLSLKQSVAQQPKAKSQTASPAPAARPQATTDEQLMQKTAQATIDWDKSSSPGVKVEALLLKTQQVNGKTVMQYHLKVTGTPLNKFYSLTMWPITAPAPVRMMDGLEVAKDGTVGCPKDSNKSCGQHMKGAELILTYTPDIGEIYRHALVSEDHASRIFFSVVPAPMMEHDKACSLEVIRLSPRFELAVIRGKGFVPGDLLNFHTASYQEVHDSHPKADPQGEFWGVVSPFVAGKTLGTTQVTVKGKSCAPSLSFEWGSE